MPEQLLVTGGAGFIGSNFIRLAISSRPDVRIVNLDALTYCGNLENLADLAGEPRLIFVHGSINDEALVDRLVDRSDQIVHFAAESHVDRSIDNARPFVETNVQGTQVLLDALRRYPGRRLLHISTDEVYGSLSLNEPDERFREESPLKPNSPYAASKAAADLLVRSYHQTYGVDVVITRCSNNFGPYQFPEKIIPLFVVRLLQGGQVPLYGDGMHVRDWIHVEDHCEAVLQVLERGTTGEVYNIGGNNERSNLDLTRLILAALGLAEDRIQHVADRPGHDRRYAIDSSRILAELGWTPTRSAWPEALESTIRWYQEHESWWRRIETGEYLQTNARYVED